MVFHGSQRLAIVGLAAMLAACAGGGGAGRTATSSATQRALPAAETLDSDLVMTPVGRDARGCVQYQMRSIKRPSVDAVFYRTRYGDFSTISEEAACT